VGTIGTNATAVARDALVVMALIRPANQ
jgi:hypothetical protein